jgi:multidrug efflux system outer membrane protein
MGKRTFSLLAAAAVLLTGCTLAPNYTRPEAPVPAPWPTGAAYDNAQASPPGAPEAAGLAWREFFADERLRKVIETALKGNRDLRLAALNVERTRALFGIQRAELLPAVDASGIGSKQRLSADLLGAGDPRTREQYSLDLGVASWEIDLFGRIRSLKDRALEEYLATDEARRGARIALVSEVARRYLVLAADREMLALARATLDTQRAAYDLTRKRYDAGLANELDLRRAQTPADAARGDVARFIRSEAQDRNALNLLAGSMVPEEMLPVDLGSVTPPREVSPGLSSEALLRRPDIMAAEHRLKGAYAFIGAARAAFLPRIALTTSIGTASDELSGLFRSGTDTWNFAPKIVMPIFDARVRAAYRLSKADREIVLAQYEKTIQAAFREVADSLAVKGTIDRQVEAQQSLTAAVSETYRLAEKRYAKGVDGYLGVLDAQRSLYAAQQGLVSLRLAKLANQVTLYAVLGGGGDPTSPR